MIFNLLLYFFALMICYFKLEFFFFLSLPRQNNSDSIALLDFFFLGLNILWRFRLNLHVSKATIGLLVSSRDYGEGWLAYFYS